MANLSINAVCAFSPGEEVSLIVSLRPFGRTPFFAAHAWLLDGSGSRSIRHLSFLSLSSLCSTIPSKKIKASSPNSSAARV
jgi:hypothetical protein